VLLPESTGESDRLANTVWYAGGGGGGGGKFTFVGDVSTEARWSRKLGGAIRVRGSSPWENAHRSSKGHW